MVEMSARSARSQIRPQTAAGYSPPHAAHTRPQTAAHTVQNLDDHPLPPMRAVSTSLHTSSAVAPHDLGGCLASSTSGITATPRAPPEPSSVDDHGEPARFRRGLRSTRMKPSMWGDHAQLWPQLPPVMRIAALNTERRHDNATKRAEAALKTLEVDPTSVRAQEAFEARLGALRGGRYLVQPLRMRTLTSPRSPQPRGLLHHRLESLATGGAESGPWMLDYQVCLCVCASSSAAVVRGVRLSLCAAVTCARWQRQMKNPTAVATRGRSGR